MFMCAQVSGIGFLGGGAIVKKGLDVQGLSTAAALWVCVLTSVICTHPDKWLPLGECSDWNGLCHCVLVSCSGYHSHCPGMQPQLHVLQEQQRQQQQQQ